MGRVVDSFSAVTSRLWGSRDREKPSQVSQAEVDDHDDDEEEVQEEVVAQPEAPRESDALANLIETALSGEAPSMLMALRQVGDAFDYTINTFQEVNLQLDSIQQTVADGSVLDAQQTQDAQESRDRLFLTNFKPVLDASFQYALGQFDLFQRTYSRQLVGGELVKSLDGIKSSKRVFGAISEGKANVTIDQLREFYAEFASALRDLRNALVDTHNQIIEVMTMGESKAIDGEIARIFLEYANFPELPEDQDDLDDGDKAEYEECREEAVNIAFAFDRTISQADAEWWQSLNENEQAAFRQQFERERSSAFMHTFFLDMGQLYRTQVQMQDITEDVLAIVGQLPKDVIVTKKPTGTATDGGSLKKEWTSLQAGLGEFLQEQQDIYSDVKKIKQLKGLISKIYDAAITLPPQADARGPVDVVTMRGELKRLHALLDNWIRQLDAAHKRQPLLMKGDVFLHASPEMVSLGDALAQKVEAAQKALGNESDSGDSNFLAALIVGAEQASQIPKQRYLREWRENLEQNIEAARQELIQKQIAGTRATSTPVVGEQSQSADTSVVKKRFKSAKAAELPLQTTDEQWQAELQRQFEAATQLAE